LAKSAKLLALRGKAKREGWLKYIRQGEGEEADERAMLNGCRYDPRRAEHWLEFADKYGTLTEGPWKGKPFRLLPWQADSTARFFGWVKFNDEWESEVRRFRFLYLEVPKKNGKALALDTEIPTVDGWKTMADIQVGDYVFDEFGHPTEVLFVSAVHTGRQCFEVKFSTGETIIADAEHLWTVRCRKPENKVLTLTTAQMVDECWLDCRGSEGSNYSVRCCDPVAFPEAELPIDPYVLGAWLGDGESSSARFYSDDAEVVAEIGRTQTITKRPAKFRFVIQSGASRPNFQSQLRSSGLLNNKHIPAEYLSASIEQRLSLLQGLMDTDGTVDRKGECEFSVTSRRLASDAFDLIRSLGLKATFRERPAKLYGRQVGVRFRIQFSPNGMPVFRLSRKASRCRPAIERKIVRSRWRQIRSIKPVESVPVKCIGVASKNQLYMASRACIPTHNTPLLSLIGNYLLFGDSWDRQINLYLAATTRKQAERCLTHAIRQVKNRDELAQVARIRKLEGFSQIEYGDNHWNVVAADPDSADGVNGHCLADELHRWKGFEFFNALKWMLAGQPEGVFAGITTAGSEMQSVCRSLHEKTKAVNSGRQIDEAHYGSIWAASPDDDPHEESTWLKANPSLGRTKDHPLKLSTFRQDYEAAKNEPSQWPAFMQLRLNVWRTAEHGWLDEACPRGLADWDSGPTERNRSKRRIDCYEMFDPDTLDGEAWLGLDFAAVRDTNAATVAVRRKDGTICIVPHVWMPEREAERQAKRVPYQSWADDGWLKLTPGDVVDYNVIFKDLLEIVDRFQVSRFYYDPLFQAEWLTQRLEEESGAERWEFPQRVQDYAPVIREVERMIIGHELRHNGNPIATWQIGNAMAYSNANGDKRLVKQKHGDYRKVDVPQSMLMALKDAVTGLDEVPDFYDDNDVELV
jgi:phage terminase large subunit-like protein